MKNKYFCSLPLKDKRIINDLIYIMAYATEMGKKCKYKLDLEEMCDNLSSALWIFTAVITNDEDAACNAIFEDAMLECDAMIETPEK